MASYFPAMIFTNELFPAPISPKMMKFAGCALLRFARTHAMDAEEYCGCGRYYMMRIISFEENHLPTEEDTRRPPLESLSSDHQIRSRAKNIVIFGKTSSGKRSVINAIAQRQFATMLLDALLTIKGMRWDFLAGFVTPPGLDEETGGTVATEAEENLNRFLPSSTLGGIDLLVYLLQVTPSYSWRFL
ncbi:hypothetical protein K503DRAFT_860128 [Rhizopogon vinicolor AM-OR11-026]|uniref:G domain-containing protein n=1 Tax=Rhizopogon vinicolor AM-OR11-026 TaxID=1314800 RepID=A0A1B7MJP1_9AGAM|nr:hypothetical protein K503DRAFT_860128 [Rhizopogon vinicolor AM-OR11-026]